MRYLILYLSLISSPVFAGELPLNELRALFQKSAFEEASCRKLISLIKDNNESKDHTMAAYKACATMMMAKYVFNPFTKLSNFHKGKKMLEHCVQDSKGNIEIIFLRFTVQCNAPRFLNYHSSILNDKMHLLNSIDKLTDMQLKEIIIHYLKTSEHLSATEKQNLIS